MSIPPFQKSEEYKRIFSFVSKKINKVASKESSWLEFKESFNWASRSSYSKSMSAFSNRGGGFIVFGISNDKALVGLQNNNFENIDEGKISGYLNSALSPEIDFEKIILKVRSKSIGILRIYESSDKPIVCTKNDGDSLKEGEIYYRYNARSEKIKYAELRKILKHIQEKEAENWMNLFSKISKIGSSNAAILDLLNGKIENKKSTLLIDKKVIDQIKFIKEGSFREKGWPTLKLIGEVKPILSKAGIRITSNLNAPAVRIEEENLIKKEYSLDYFLLVNKLKERFSNISINSRFHTVKKQIQERNPQFCKTRYLDPINMSGSKKNYYSPKIIKEFDKFYTKK